MGNELAATDSDLVRHCHAVTRAGMPCNAPPVFGTDYCMSHSPADIKASLGFSGEAGKLGGRPRIPRATELMRQKVEDEKERIIGVYWDAMHATNKDGEPDHQIRLQALRDLLDRVYGKPTTKTELTGDLTLDLSTLAARARGELEDAG